MKKFAVLITYYNRFWNQVQFDGSNYSAYFLTKLPENKSIYSNDQYLTENIDDAKLFTFEDGLIMMDEVKNNIKRFSKCNEETVITLVFKNYIKI